MLLRVCQGQHFIVSGPFQQSITVNGKQTRVKLAVTGQHRAAIFFLAVFLRVICDGLNERGNNRTLNRIQN